MPVTDNFATNNRTDPSVLPHPSCAPASHGGNSHAVSLSLCNSLEIAWNARPTDIQRHETNAASIPPFKFPYTHTTGRTAIMAVSSALLVVAVLAGLTVTGMAASVAGSDGDWCGSNPREVSGCNRHCRVIVASPPTYTFYF